MSENKEKYGLLIDYEYCTGCHTCETACKVEHSLTTGQWGIKVMSDGPRKLETGKFEFINVPLPTSLCDLCSSRVKKGKLPTCVQHCQSAVMSYGTLAELGVKLAEKPQMVLFAL
jgi:Fe-S-cluster-containing dehydrogenase component